MKIALVQTGCWGDNINSTLMLGPLKAAYPTSVIDVFTSDMYASAFYNNPLINNIIQHPARIKMDAVSLCRRINPKGYDLLFNPHPYYNESKQRSNLHPKWGSNIIYAYVRALEDANIPYTVPLETGLFLSRDEVHNVDMFLANNDIDYAPRNLLEMTAESGQSFWNEQWVEAVVRILCGRGEVCFISHKVGHPTLPREFRGKCFNVHCLSIRECAELYNRCDVFWSCSSGLANACTTSWCKPKPWVEVINHTSVNTAPVRSDMKRFWYENNLEKFLAHFLPKYASWQQ